jgi:hypothetical protein
MAHDFEEGVMDGKRIDNAINLPLRIRYYVMIDNDNRGVLPKARKHENTAYACGMSKNFTFPVELS